MKLLITLSILALVLVACSQKAVDTVPEDQTIPTETLPENTQTTEVETIDAGVEEINQLNEDLDFEEIDGIDQELEDFTW